MFVTDIVVQKRKWLVIGDMTRRSYQQNVHLYTVLHATRSRTRTRTLGYRQQWMSWLPGIECIAMLCQSFQVLVTSITFFIFRYNTDIKHYNFFLQIQHMIIVVIQHTWVAGNKNVVHNTLSLTAYEHALLVCGLCLIRWRLSALLPIIVNARYRTLSMNHET